jgi:hypothetical protein
LSPDTCNLHGFGTGCRTYDYIERELLKVPSGLPVLVLANHRDMGHHRTVTEDKVRYFIEELDR